MLRQVGIAVLAGEGVPAPIEQLVIAEDAFAEAAPALAIGLRAILDLMRPEFPQIQSARIAPKPSKHGETRFVPFRDGSM